jgi:hypothetical protein
MSRRGLDVIRTGDPEVAARRLELVVGLATARRHAGIRGASDPFGLYKKLLIGIVAAFQIPTLVFFLRRGLVVTPRSALRERLDHQHRTA